MFEIIESRWNNDYRVSIDTVGMDYESAVEAMPRLYGVSFGNGNDGVSHMFASYYVRTCEPFVLAAAAMLSEFSDGEGKAWAIDQIEIDGEADYTISATVLNPPDDETESNDDCDSDDDCGTWSDSNGAWMICEVFPDDEPRSGRMVYDSLSDAFDAHLIEHARAI